MLSTDTPVCCVCECKEGEEDRHLTFIPVFGGSIPMCQICTIVSRTHCIQKCRKCGAVATIRWENTPAMGIQIQGYCAVIFTENCKFCGG